MNLLFKIIYASQASSTHHKLALDALSHLGHSSASSWTDLFLQHHAVYLRGAKDPDVIFKDFRNHVIHVDQDFWGGAATTARSWYDRTVELLAKRQWDQAVYAAGVLSHYVTDPLMPFHTGQTKRESEIHRAAEWSVTKSYDDLRRMAVLQNQLPSIKVPTGEYWLEDFVKQGAELSHKYYQPLIDHYRFDLGVSDPPAGWDDYSRKVLAQLLMYGAVSFSMILDRAFLESKAVPPECDLTLETFLATLAIPIKWVTKKLEHAQERAHIEAIYNELKITGELVHNLPEEQKSVRAASQAAMVALPKPSRPSLARPIGAASEASHLQPVKKVEKQTPLTGSQAVPPHPFVVTQKLASASEPLFSPPPPAPKRVSVPTPKNVEASPKPLFTPTSSASTPATPLLSPASKPTHTPAPPTISKVNAIQDRQKQEELELIESQRELIELRETLAQKARSTAQTQPPTRPATNNTLTFYLDLASDLVDAPSIGPKTAARFYRIGAKTVQDLLRLDPKTTAHRINTSHIKPDTIRDWQDQARLVCQIPELRGTHAQILVGCGYRTPDDVCRASVADLANQVYEFGQTSIGQSILRSGSPPDEDKLKSWVENARSARALNAA